MFEEALGAIHSAISTVRSRFTTVTLFKFFSGTTVTAFVSSLLLIIGNSTQSSLPCYPQRYLSCRLWIEAGFIQQLFHTLLTRHAAQFDMLFNKHTLPGTFVKCWDKELLEE